MATFTTLTQHCTGSFTQCNKARKKKRKSTDPKVRNKLSLFAVDMVACIGNLKESTKKTLRNSKWIKQGHKTQGKQIKIVFIY